MGTTVTSNLGLIKPDTDESIKPDGPMPGWADQNADNMDTIDALFRASTGTYSVTFTAATTNPTLGTGGFTEGKWVRLFPRMVIVFFRVVAGSTFTAGSGDYRINLPFAMDASLIGSDGGRTLPVGKAIFWDSNNVVASSAFLCLYDPVNNWVEFELSQGDIFASSYPMAASDRLSGYLMYPTSDA